MTVLVEGTPGRVCRDKNERAFVPVFYLKKNGGYAWYKVDLGRDEDLIRALCDRLGGPEYVTDLKGVELDPEHEATVQQIAVTVRAVKWGDKAFTAYRWALEA